ncbi:MAG: serine/threonine-protein kinase, partial [Myxococcota bacterium]
MTAPVLPPDAPSLAEGRYVLLSRIGEGGMAAVYRAFDTKLRVWRAVKVLVPAYAKRRSVRERFESEAQTMALLEQPNLVRVFDVGSMDGLPFLVMEYVGGGTLDLWVDRHGPMPPRMAVEAVRQVALALVAVHAQGVVHRDVKPNNILVAANGTCKLTDFGVARTEMDPTHPGQLLGTLGYMAPEQRVDAAGVDARADLYGLGATLWHLLRAEQPNDLFLAHHEPKLLDRIPPVLRPILLRAVAHERRDRYPSAEKFAHDLEDVLSGLPMPAPGTPPLVQPPGEREVPVAGKTIPELAVSLDSDSGLGRSLSRSMPPFTARGSDVSGTGSSGGRARRSRPPSPLEAVPAWMEHNGPPATTTAGGARTRENAAPPSQSTTGSGATTG